MNMSHYFILVVSSFQPLFKWFFVKQPKKGSYSMKRYLYLLTTALLSSTTSVAQITDIPCANGGGVIVKGTISGEYCMSNNDMNWWNANSWCDALNKKLINRPDDCECASDGYAKCNSNRCPNFILSTTETISSLWMGDPRPSSGMLYVHPETGAMYQNSTRTWNGRRAICR